METAVNSVKDALTSENSLSEYFTNQFVSLTPWKILIGLLLGFLVGLVIAFVYKRCYRGVLYSPTFALTLMMLVTAVTQVFGTTALPSVTAAWTSGRTRSALPWRTRKS